MKKLIKLLQGWHKEKPSHDHTPRPWRLKSAGHCAANYCTLAFAIMATFFAIASRGDDSKLGYISGASASDEGPQDGVFDQFTQPNFGSVNNNGYTSFATAMDFPLPAISVASAVSKASLSLRVNSVEGTRSLVLYGYAADGKISLKDFSAGQPVARIVLHPSAMVPVMFDVTDFVRNLLTDGRPFAGFVLREEPANTSNFTVLFFSMIGPPAPQLLIQSSPIMDSDGDGVPDPLDMCTDTPPGSVVDAHGCSIDPIALGGLGTAVLDGVLAPEEWTNAGVLNVAIHLPGGGATPGKVYVMNDLTNIYFGVRFQRAVVDGGNSAGFYFINNPSLGASPGDDAIVYNPGFGFNDTLYAVYQGCPTNQLCNYTDTDVGGRIDGNGAFANDGTDTVYEVSHPLSSGDPNDISLTPGQSINVWVFVRIINQDGLADTDLRFITIKTFQPPPRSPLSHIFVGPLMDLPGAVGRLVLASTQARAEVVLDGSASRAAAGGPLNFVWREGGLTLGGSKNLIRKFALGSHTVELTVREGDFSGSNSVTFRIIKSTEAIDLMTAALEAWSLRDPLKGKLRDSLQSAKTAIDLSYHHLGAHYMRVFQRLVNAELAPVNADAANRLLVPVKALIDIEGARPGRPTAAPYVY